MLSTLFLVFMMHSFFAHRNQLLAVRHDNRAGLSGYHPALRVVCNLTVTTRSGSGLIWGENSI